MYNKFVSDKSGRLIYETNTKTYYQEGSETYEIVYLYDDSGVVGMAYIKNGVTSAYYFQKNLMGDVVAVYDTNGAKIASYNYDAWGNCTIASSTTNYTIAHANPFRYRSYYYDEDTKLYYLKARYYSPEFRRFISPDDTEYLNTKNVNGLNLYCYCNNDPVNYCDPSGHELLTMIVGLIGCFGPVVTIIFTGFVVILGEIFAGIKKPKKEAEYSPQPKDKQINPGYDLSVLESLPDMGSAYYRKVFFSNTPLENAGPFGGGGGGGLFDPVLEKFFE